jgi:mono/diheme cytochrome c family protein
VNTTVLVIGILALAGVAVIGFLIANATRDRRAVENVPPGMRPAYSDEELERTVLERYMAWGVVLTLILAIFFPVYWLLETNRLTEATSQRWRTQVVQGEDLYQANCAKCHRADLEGLDAGEGHPGPSLVDVFDRHSEESILGILRNGIKVPAGTMMPPWQEGYMYEDARFTDDALERIIEYLHEQQPEQGTQQAESAPGTTGA